jgi:hypothetical protein
MTYWNIFIFVEAVTAWSAVVFCQKASCGLSRFVRAPSLLNGMCTVTSRTVIVRLKWEPVISQWQCEDLQHYPILINHKTSWTHSIISPSVGIVRSRTKGHGVCLFCLYNQPTQIKFPKIKIYFIISCIKLEIRMAYSGMLRRVALARTDVSEELSASIIRVTKIGELGT